MTHFVFFPAMEFITASAPRRLHQAPAHRRLRTFEFRHDVQTADIELSTRAMLGGKVSISFCPGVPRTVPP